MVIVVSPHRRPISDDVREVAKIVERDFKAADTSVGAIPEGPHFGMTRVWNDEGVAGALAHTLISESLLDRPPIHLSDGRNEYELAFERTQFERTIQYNHDALNLLRQYQEYRFKVEDASQDLSLQLYRNVAGHIRLFAYVAERRQGKAKKAKGMLFSVNLTVGMRASEPGSVRVKLNQKLELKQQVPDGVSSAEFDAYKAERHAQMLDALSEAGLLVDRDSNQILLGYFDPSANCFRNIKDDPEPTQSFLDDFLLASVIKGHFMENKGYQLPWLQPARIW